MDQTTIGRWLLIIGFSIAAIGGLIWLSGKIPFLNQLGRLRGDIHYTSPDGSFSCFIPIVSSILLSIILTIVLNAVIRFLNR